MENKVTCVMNYSIGPYHQARFMAIQKIFQNNILFVELASKDKIYQWNSRAKESNAVTLFPYKEFSTISVKEMVKSVNHLLNRIQPDVIVSVSYASAAMRAATIWARRNKAVSICLSSSWKADKPRFLVWEIVKGMWCRFAYDGLFLAGIRSKEYYQGLGFPESRIWVGRNCVDNTFFVERASTIRNNREEFRKKYQLPANYFLCVARLSPEKNLERLLRSFCLYRAQGGLWDLVIVGSGPMDQSLKDLAEKLNINANVHFIGWKQVDEIPVFYALASCFILPSVSEPWGLVVNEAMASSLPILVSNRCGCLPELCINGVNGFDFDPYNVDAITNVMLNMSSEGCERLSMAKASLEIIENYSPQNYAISFLDCVSTLRKLKNIS